MEPNNLDAQNPAPAGSESPAPSKEQAPASPAPSKDSLNLAILCHVLGLVTSFLGPLILWLVKKDEDDYVDYHGREALNFQITLLIAYFVGGILSFFCIGVPIILAAWVLNVIFSILAAVAASKGECYKYPVSLHLIQ